MILFKTKNSIVRNLLALHLIVVVVVVDWVCLLLVPRHFVQFFLFLLNQFSFLEKQILFRQTWSIRSDQTFVFFLCLFPSTWTCSSVIVFRLIGWCWWTSCDAFRSIPEVQHIDKISSIEFKCFKSKNRNIFLRNQTQIHDFTWLIILGLFSFLFHHRYHCWPTFLSLD